MGICNSSQVEWHEQALAKWDADLVTMDSRIVMAENNLRTCLTGIVSGEVVTDRNMVEYSPEQQKAVVPEARKKLDELKEDRQRILEERSKILHALLVLQGRR